MSSGEVKEVSMVLVGHHIGRFKPFSNYTP